MIESGKADVQNHSRVIVSIRVDGSTYADSVRTILGMIEEGRFGYVCVANVHMVMEAHDDPVLKDVVNGAALVTSDGMPLVWGLRLLGIKSAERVYGPDLTQWLCASAEKQEVPVGFYGGSPESLDSLLEELGRKFPDLKVCFALSPPFRPPTPGENDKIAIMINDSGVKLLFVGLGCPKQEKWMAAQQHKIRAVMVGVGAAFDFISGSKPHAPQWIQRIGLEWLFRLATEPRRLWRRYMVHNPRFLVLFLKQIMRTGRGSVVA